jgi:hypothetical protein
MLNCRPADVSIRRQGRAPDARRCLFLHIGWRLDAGRRRIRSAPGQRAPMSEFGCHCERAGNQKVVAVSPGIARRMASHGAGKTPRPAPGACSVRWRSSIAMACIAESSSSSIRFPALQDEASLTFVVSRMAPGRSRRSHPRQPPARDEAHMPAVRRAAHPCRGADSSTCSCSLDISAVGKGSAQPAPLFPLELLEDALRIATFQRLVVFEIVEA